MNQNPLDAERQSLNNASGRKHAPNPDRPSRPKVGDHEMVEQAKRNSEDGRRLD